MTRLKILVVSAVLLTSLSQQVAASDPASSGAGEESAPSTAVVPPPPDAIAPAPAPELLFAVNFRIGPKWDSAKPPHQQQYFGDHSRNLKRLRDEGRILLGARYSDVGFLVVRAKTLSEAHALFENDPSVVNQVFVFEVFQMSLFYPGCVAAPGKPAS